MLVANAPLTVSTGKPVWFWAMVAIVVLIALYAAYAFFTRESPPAEQAK